MTNLAKLTRRIINGVYLFLLFVAQGADHGVGRGGGSKRSFFPPSVINSQTTITYTKLGRGIGGRSFSFSFVSFLFFKFEFAKALWEGKVEDTGGQTFVFFLCRVFLFLFCFFSTLSFFSLFLILVGLEDETGRYCHIGEV
jgi:hypothetical protein